MRPKSTPKYKYPPFDRGVPDERLELPAEDYPQEPPHWPPGFYIPYYSIWLLLLAACLLIGAGVLLFLLTELFYIAREWVHQHREGFLFAICLFVATGLLAHKLQQYFKTREDEDFV